MNADGIMGLLFSTMIEQGRQTPKEPEPDEDEKKCIRFMIEHGSGFHDGKVRIYAAAKLWSRDDPERFMQFLKDEYDVGGCSMPEKWFMDHDNKGIVFRNFKDGEHKEIRFSWKKVARLYTEDFRNGYLLADLKTMQRMWEIQRTVGLQAPVPRMKYPQ
jgi:hypothetical protein